MKLATWCGTALPVRLVQCGLVYTSHSPTFTFSGKSRSCFSTSITLPAGSLLPWQQQGLQRRVDQSSQSSQGHSCMMPKGQTGELGVNQTSPTLAADETKHQKPNLKECFFQTLLTEFITRSLLVTKSKS